MFTQLLLCGFLYVRVDGKLKILLSLPPPPKKTHFFLSVLWAINKMTLWLLVPSEPAQGLFGGRGFKSLFLNCCKWNVLVVTYCCYCCNLLN